MKPTPQEEAAALGAAESAGARAQGERGGGAVGGGKAAAGKAVDLADTVAEVVIEEDQEPPGLGPADSEASFDPPPVMGDVVGRHARHAGAGGGAAGAEGEGGGWAFALEGQLDPEAGITRVADKRWTLRRIAPPGSLGQLLVSIAWFLVAVNLAILAIILRDPWYVYPAPVITPVGLYMAARLFRKWKGHRALTIRIEETLDGPVRG